MLSSTPAGCHKRPFPNTPSQNSAKQRKLSKTVATPPANNMLRNDWRSNTTQRRIGTVILWQHLSLYLEAFSDYLDQKIEVVNWDWDGLDDQVYEDALKSFKLMRQLKMAFEVTNGDGDKELRPGFVDFLEQERLTNEYNEYR
jgi:hypothetical protein